MNIRIKSVILLCSLAVFGVSCSKPVAPDPGTDDEKIKVPDYMIVDQEYVSPDEYVSLLNNPLASIVPVDFFQEEFSKTKEALADKIELFKKSGVNIKRVIFTYYSTNKLGKKVQLSVRLDYPVGGNGQVDISSCTLFNHMFVPTASYAPTSFFCINELRVFHNAMVVVPDLQGYGTSTGVAPNYSYMLEDGRQSVDAVLIARDIVKRDRHAFLADDCPTDNLGVSRGALAALGFHKYCEDLEDEALKKYINLRGTFYAEVCPYLLAKISPMLEGRLFLNKTAAMLTCLSAIYNFPEYLGDLKPEDFFTEEFVNRKVSCQGAQMSMINAILYGTWSILEQISAWGGLSEGAGYEVLSPEFVNPDGSFIISSRQYKFFEVIDALSDFITGWKLEHPITLAFCDSDEMISPSSIDKMYTTLKNNTDQNVNLLTYSIDSVLKGLSDHALASFHWEFHCAQNPNPVFVQNQ